MYIDRFYDRNPDKTNYVPRKYIYIFLYKILYHLYHSTYYYDNTYSCPARITKVNDNKNHNIIQTIKTISVLRRIATKFVCVCVCVIAARGKRSRGCVLPIWRLRRRCLADCKFIIRVYSFDVLSGATGACCLCGNVAYNDILYYFDICIYI